MRICLSEAQEMVAVAGDDDGLSRVGQGQNGTVITVRPEQLSKSLAGVARLGDNAGDGIRDVMVQQKSQASASAICWATR